jgi:hypothetical protein
VVGLTFSTHFAGSVERNVPAAALGAWGLHYTTSDGSLIEHLGGEPRAAKPFLAYIHRLMEMSDNGSSHTDGRSNFAYMRSPPMERCGRCIGP